MISQHFLLIPRLSDCTSNLRTGNIVTIRLNNITGIWERKILSEQLEHKHTTAKKLFDAINCAGEAGDLLSCNLRIQELRDLHRDYPQDATIRERLVRGLANIINFAGRVVNLKSYDSLLQELRDLYIAYPEELAIRESLAMGLFININWAEDAGNLQRCEPLLQEINDLHRAYPEDHLLKQTLELICQ